MLFPGKPLLNREASAARHVARMKYRSTIYLRCNAPTRPAGEGARGRTESHEVKASPGEGAGAHPEHKDLVYPGRERNQRGY